MANDTWCIQVPVILGNISVCRGCNVTHTEEYVKPPELPDLSKYKSKCTQWPRAHPCCEPCPTTTEPPTSTGTTTTNATGTTLSTATGTTLTTATGTTFIGTTIATAIGTTINGTTGFTPGGTITSTVTPQVLPNVTWMYSLFTLLGFMVFLAIINWRRARRVSKATQKKDDQILLVYPPNPSSKKYYRLRFGTSKPSPVPDSPPAQKNPAFENDYEKEPTHPMMESTAPANNQGYVSNVEDETGGSDKDFGDASLARVKLQPDPNEKKSSEKMKGEDN
ncbi:uncharacterized protein LOC110976606 isoform X1 [Acanthaster planci]|uniref:Uncharacterized protein LOC110976606 isoform X1 n=1 Tax=Acanthaster planci TaxID=133434 RepID=A0A8B7Y193_ACAPL|nr:uncharacterized protein LOC110976606 isoform X1 [Acanthaster planci]